MARDYENPRGTGAASTIDDTEHRNQDDDIGGRRVVRASKIQGKSVKNPAGEALGKIEDIMIDTMSGRITYAVLSFGGFLGVGNKLFAIPFEALAINQRDRHFVLDIPKEKLERAPGFDKDDWPDMANQTWGFQVYTYYGYKPYWERDYDRDRDHDLVR